MRGEQGGRAGRLDGLVEGQPVVLDELADALDAEEAGVALVGVEHVRRGRTGQPAVGAQRADAADAQQHLLEQPVLAAAAVEPVGDVALGRLVVLDVGVEQQQRHPADLRLPDLRDQVPPAGQPDLDLERAAVGLAQQRDRQAVRVEHRVALLLPALAGQRLGEVAGPVEQAHADDRHAEVGGGLEVVAGQDAQAAGVLRQRGGDAVLGREVGDRRTGRRRPRWPRRARPGTSGRPRGRPAGPRPRPRPGGRPRGRRPGRRAAPGRGRRAAGRGRLRPRPTARGPGSRRAPGSWCPSTSAGSGRARPGDREPRGARCGR